MIDIEYVDNIGIITFDCRKGNALSYEDLFDFNSILSSKGVENSDGLILTGKNRSFCTGLNLLDCNKPITDAFELLDHILYGLYSYDRPLVVASTGHSIGAGFLFLLCADYVFMPNQPKIKLGLPEINIGLGLDQLMMNLVKKKFSSSVTTKLVYSGKLLGSNELSNYDLIDEYVDDTLVVERGIQAISEIKSHKIESFRYCKRILREDDLKAMSLYINQQCYKELAVLYGKNKSND